MQYAPTLPADGTRWPVKWFPTEANERRAHVSENIPGVDERHPPIKWFSTEANGRRAHVSENIPGANERQRPLSDVRVGAQKHTPPMFPTGNNNAYRVSAAIGFHFIGGWVSTAAVGFVPCGVI